jgi:predicted MFS family arabinose efflux permease
MTERRSASFPSEPPTEPPTGAAPPAPALPRGAITCLSLAAFGSGLSLRINDALLPKLAAEFGVTLGQASQVVSAFAIAYGVAQLLFGPLGDRYGKYRVVAWATLACAVSALLCALAPGFVALRAARVLAGISAAAIIPLAMAWIGDVVPYAQRQPVIARFLIGQIAGLSLGVGLGGFAADYLTWRTPYVLISLLFAGVCAALLTLDRRLPATARTTRRAGAAPLRQATAEFAAVLADPWARTLLGLVFLEGLFLYGPFAFIAAHMHGVFGLSLAASGSVLMLFGAGGLVFAVASRALVGGLGERGLVRWGGAVLVVAYLAVGLAPSWQWPLAGCFLAGVGFYMVHNTLQVNATQMQPERRGAAVSAFAASFFLGQSVGVTLGGWWVGAFATGGLMVCGALGLAGVAWLFASRLAKHAAPPAGGA